MGNEIWKAVFDGTYHVSDFGRVKRVRVYNNRRWSESGVLKSWLSTTGYPTVSLWSDNKGRFFAVHRLVMLAFVGRCPVGCNVNHKNGTKTDNRLENLEYITFSGNSQHASDTGLMDSGETHYRTKLTKADVLGIRARYIPGSRSRPGNEKILACEFKIGRQAVSKIVNRVSWKHI